MATLDESFGIISAYGYALTKGFNGTEEEFAEMMAHIGDWYEEAEELAKSSNAVTAKSYAIGGTGTRDGEDTDNARYYADQASADSDSAEASATAAAKSAEEAATSANNAKNSAGNATKSQKSAETSANTAAGQAEAAAKSATSAEASATAAAKSAESLAVGLLFSITNEGLLHIERKE